MDGEMWWVVVVVVVGWDRRGEERRGWNGMG